MDSVCRSSRWGAVFLWIVLGIALGCAAAVMIGRVSPEVLAASMVPLFAVIGVGVAFPSSGIFARPVLSAQTGRPEVALTFDDGPDPVWTPRLLDLLDSRGQKATFFVIGQQASMHLELLRDIVERGHEIANHTWWHSYLTVFRAPRMLARELEKTSALIQSATGCAPTWFRTPVGLLSPRIPIATRLAGLKLVGWTETARDGVSRTTVDQAIHRLSRQLRPGAILVLHDRRVQGSGDPIAVAVASEIIDRLDAAGLRSVTLSSLCKPS